MQKLMGDEGWGGGPCFSLLTPSVCACEVPNEAVNSLALISFCKQFGTRSGLSGLIGIEIVWNSDGKHYIFFVRKS